MPTTRDTLDKSDSDSPAEDALAPAEGLVLDPLLGALVAGRYRVEALIGEGGIGRVYRAEHEQLGRKVALKLLHPEFTARADLVLRFEREARAASRLSHSGSVVVYDFGTWEGLLYIAMELINGRSLDELVQAEAPLTVTRIIDLATQLCDTLEAAHNLGLLHRDLKPENILVTLGPDGREITKVCDYGLAFIAGGGERASQRLTPEGALMGTPAFMSPEQIMNRAPDQRTDVYSLGCVLYEMSCGLLPFSGSTPMETITRQLYEEPEAPSRRTSQAISRELERVVMWTLNKDPARRPQDAAALRSALQAVLTPSSRRSERPSNVEVQPLFDRERRVEAMGISAAPEIATAEAASGALEVLVVAPQPIPFERSVVPTLRSQGCLVRTAHDFESSQGCEAIVVDVRQDAPTGVSLLAAALTRLPHLAVAALVVIGPDDDFASMTRTLELQRAEYVPESLLPSLPRKLRRALERVRRHKS